MTTDIQRHIADGNWEAAKRHAESVVDTQPANPLGHAYLGYVLAHFGNYERAAECLRVATTLDNQLWQAGILLAQVLDRLLRFQEALEVTEAFLKVKPSHPTLVHLREGLKRNVPEKITDSWQKSVFLDWHSVELPQHE